MSRLKPWLPLILIASVLLLGGVKSATESSAPCQSLTEQRSNATDRSENPSSRTTPVNSPNSQSSATDGAHDRDQATPWLCEVLEWIGMITGQGFFTFVTTVATVFLAIFTYYLVKVTRDLHTATEAATETAKRGVKVQLLAANAADKSAAFAELALNINRPYLFAEEPTLTAIEEALLSVSAPILDALTRDRLSNNGMGIRVSLTLRNRGKGVAIFNRLAARLLLTLEPFGARPYRYINGGKFYSMVRARIIGPEEHSVCDLAGVRLTNEQWESIRSGIHLGVIIRGVLLYEDSLRRSLWTRFTFEYHPPTEAIQQGNLTLPAIAGFLYPSPSAKMNRFN